MSVIDEVKQKADIVEVINQYTTLTKAGRTFRALCPFHSEKRPSFFVYPERQSWHCFGACSTGGDVFSFIMKRENTDFGEALRLLAQRVGVTLPSRSGQDTDKDKRARLYQAHGAAAQYFHNLLLNSPAGEKGRQYLVNRGLTAQSISDFQLGYSLNSWEALKQYLLEKGFTESEQTQAGLIIAAEDGTKHDRFRHRLMFPINDERGRTTGFGARALDDSFPKYLNSPQTPLFDKSRHLYGINLATPAIRQQNQAVVVEGYLDVIIAHQNGFNDVVASMGIAVTESQVNTLKRLTRNMVLALDADVAGEEAMLRCISYENTLEAEIKMVILPRGKDPDDVIKEDTNTWRRLLDEAIPVVDYTFQAVAAKLDLTTARDKSLAVDRLLPIIAQIKDNTRRDHYLNKLSRLSGTTYRHLESTLELSTARQRTKQPLAQKSALPTEHPLLSSPLEEDCLTLLLQNPRLKEASQSLQPEYFENSQNRAIFLAWQPTTDLPALKNKLDTAIWEYLDTLLSKSLPPTRVEVEQRYRSYALRLREQFLRNLEASKAETLALEAETGGTAAELAKLQEEGIEASIGLREVFTEKARKGLEPRR